MTHTKLWLPQTGRTSEYIASVDGDGDIEVMWGDNEDKAYYIAKENIPLLVKWILEEGLLDD